LSSLSGGAKPCRAGAKPRTGLRSWRRLPGGSPRGSDVRSRAEPRGNPPGNRLQLLSPVLGFAPARHRHASAAAGQHTNPAVVLGRVCKGVDPDEDGAEVEHGEVVGRALLVAGRKAPELFQAVEQALHSVACPIRRTVEPRPTPLARLGRDHRPDAPAPQVLARGAARKGLVAHHTPRSQARAPAALATNRTCIEQGWKSDAVVALAAGQVKGDRLAVPFSPDVDLGREAPARAAERLTPRQRRSGERRRRADGRGSRLHPRSAGPSRAGPPHRPAPARRPAYAARSRPCANGRTGSTRSRPGRSAPASRARARPCAAPREYRSGGCDGCGSGDPFGAAQGAEAAPSAATAHPSTRNASHPLDGRADPATHPFADTP